MSLTKTDLSAIQEIVEGAIKTHVAPMIEEAVDTLAQGTAAGFADVYGRLDKADSRLDKIDGRLDKIDGRLDEVDGRLGRVEEELGDLSAKVTRIELAQRNDVTDLDDHEVRISKLEHKVA